VSGGPDLTPEDVREILRLIDGSPYEELELETPRFSLRLGRTGRDAEPADDRQAAAPEAGADGLVDVTAPMVGVFYRAPAPGAEPFVEVGSRVEPGTQVCIVEVMKLMNAVSADVSGVVAEVCAENAAVVENGDVLFRIRPDA
jgi:biotin carboxyl carrier protein